MRLFLINLLVISAISLLYCKSHDKFPKNLDDAISYFEHNWKKVELDSFRILPEHEAVTSHHFGTGLWIRNNWIYDKRDTALTNYFHSLGIYHPDDISDIILTTLHRKLNDKNIALDEQVSSKRNYWGPIFECEKNLKTEATIKYKNKKEGDPVTIYMPVDSAGGNRNAVILSCPNMEWQYDPQKDLLIKGTIAKKYFINDSANVFFAVNIKEMKPNGILVLMKNTKVGDTRDFSLIGLRIE